MFIAFLLEGLGIYILTRFASDPLAFVVVTGLVFFAWGEIYSLFPATCGDTFGRRFAATNYGLLYTAKGTAALLVPYGNTIRDATGSWLTVLYVAAALNILAAFLAMFVLKPMRRRFIRRSMEIRARARIEAGMEQAGMDEVGLEGNETLAEADVERRGAAILAFGALVLLLGAGALFAWESPPQVPARIADSSLAATAAAGPKAVPVAKPAAAPPVPAVGALAPGAQPATVPAATGPNATPQSPASPAAPAQGGPAQPAPAAKLALAAPQPTPPVQTTPQPTTPQPTASQPAGAPLQPAQPAIVAKPAPVPVALPPPPPPPPPPVEPDMISVRGGRFRMGSTENPTELPVHVVTVAAFKLSRTAVTLKEWSACVAAHVCKPVAEGAPDQPVTNVTWDEAQAYAVWLSASTEQHYRLPTEAEWEYAARAGTKTRYSWGNKMLPGRASCKGCGTEQDPNEPPAVAKYPPNPFGFYDMGGGVSEWVADCWHDSYAGAPANGNVAWSKPGCDEHVLRGGAWIESANALRVSARENFLGSIRDVSHGFRLAMSQ
jgi:formylglycine-generating enzyme required for sulfatase activity